VTNAGGTDPTQAIPIAYGSIERPDGRSVGWTTWGAATGATVIGQPHAGATGRRALAVDMVALADAGVRLTFVSRAGLGPSSRLPGRTPDTDADDMLAVIDALGIDRADLLGECGGTGAVLSLAARRPDRVRAVAIVSGMAPLFGPQADEYVGPVLGSYRRWFRFAPVARWTARRAVAAFQRDAIGAFERAIPRLPPPDRVFTDDPVRRSHAISLNSEFMASPERYLDEWRSIGGPWTFDLAAIHAPVQIDHGELDTTTPVAMARWLARQITTVDLRIDAERGHFLAPARLAHLLAGLVAGDP
jgi:pimeloyl-ACP methyl ester carboxylesterase